MRDEDLMSDLRDIVWTACSTWATHRYPGRLITDQAVKELYGIILSERKKATKKANARKKERV